LCFCGQRFSELSTSGNGMIALALEAPGCEPEMTYNLSARLRTTTVTAGNRRPASVRSLEGSGIHLDQTDPVTGTVATGMINLPSVRICHYTESDRLEPGYENHNRKHIADNFRAS